MKTYLKSVITLAVVAVAALVGASTAVGYGGGGGVSYGSASYYVTPTVTTPTPTVTTPTPTTPAPTGQVLGAESFNFVVNLGIGMSNDAVMELQKRLAAEGFFKVNPTGYFGPITLQAVKDYQKAHGIIQTGFVGPLTRAALNG